MSVPETAGASSGAPDVDVLSSTLRAMDEKLNRILDEQSKITARLQQLEVGRTGAPSATEEVGEVEAVQDQLSRSSLAGGGIVKTSGDLASSLKRVHQITDHSVSQPDKAMKMELKKISKLQADEVYGLSSEKVNLKNAVQSRSEQRNQSQVHMAAKQLLIMPNSRFRLYWDGVACSLVLFIALVLPYRTAFVTQWYLSWTIVDFLVDCFFIIDIFINCRTVYVTDTGEFVLSTRKIFLRYARSWLALDLISSVPVDWFRNGVSFEEPVEGSGTSAVQLTLLLRIFKLVKLLRLLRVARLFRYLAKFEETLHFLNSNVVRLLKLLFVLLFFSHWNGCIQYFIASFDIIVDANTSETVFHPDTWVVRSRIMEQSEPMKWSWCFYHAMTQLLAISVGVVPPSRPAELWGYLISILLGAALYAIFVATLTAVFTELGASGREYRSKIDMLHQYAKNLRMPKDLTDKLQAYYELCFPARQMFHEDEILHALSHPLQSQVALLKCNSVLTALRVLHDENLSRTLALFLERVVFIDDDFIIRGGDFGRGMCAPAAPPTPDPDPRPQGRACCPAALIFRDDTPCTRPPARRALDQRLPRSPALFWQVLYLGGGGRDLRQRHPGHNARHACLFWGDGPPRPLWPCHRRCARQGLLRGVPSLARELPPAPGAVPRLSLVHRKRRAAASRAHRGEQQQEQLPGGREADPQEGQGHGRSTAEAIDVRRDGVDGAPRHDEEAGQAPLVGGAVHGLWGEQGNRGRLQGARRPQKVMWGIIDCAHADCHCVGLIGRDGCLKLANLSCWGFLGARSCQYGIDRMRSTSSALYERATERAVESSAGRHHARVVCSWFYHVSQRPPTVYYYVRVATLHPSILSAR